MPQQTNSLLVLQWCTKSTTQNICVSERHENAPKWCIFQKNQGTYSRKILKSVPFPCVPLWTQPQYNISFAYGFKWLLILERLLCNIIKGSLGWCNKKEAAFMMFMQSKKSLCIVKVEEQDPCESLGLPICSVVGLAEAASTSWNGGEGGWQRGGSWSGVTAPSPAHLHIPSTKRSWPNLVGGSKVAPLTPLFCMSNSCYPTTVLVKRRKIIWERPNSYRHNCCLFAYTATVILQLTNLICGL